MIVLKLLPYSLFYGLMVRLYLESINNENKDINF